jgi:ribonuclease T1
VPPQRTSFSRRPLLALVILVLLLGGGYAVRALHGLNAHTTRPVTSISTVPLSSLPEQARQTIEEIQRGGPFPYPHDGIVYQNLERHLPAEPAGYYHEYTVVTPGSADRGTRRIITGGDRFYYTGDHYTTFVLIQLNR